MCNNILNIKSKIYSINSISKNWWKKEYFLAPTHEISVSQALSRYIKYENDLPLKLFHIWPAFRKQYNSLWIEKAKNISDDLKNYIKEFNNLNNNLEKIKST